MSIECMIIKIWVQSSCFEFLVLCVEYFENIFANKLIVSIKVQTDGIFCTVFNIGIVIVLHGTFFDSVIDVNIFTRRNFVKFEIVSEYLIASIGWAIIGDYSKIVWVILGKNRVEVVLYSEIGVIFITWR